VNGASLVVRTTAFDKTLPALIAQGISNDGFSLLDIWELCAAYYVPNNNLDRGTLENLIAKLGLRTGIVHQESRDEYTQAYRKQTATQLGKPTLKSEALKTSYGATLDRSLRIVIAGAAGQKVVSAAGLLGTGGLLSGLWATRRDDYPVTVMTGHSISEVILSPSEIYYTGIEHPDIFLAIAPEGLKAARNQFDSLAESDTLYIRQDMLPVQTQARVVPLNFKGVSRKDAAVSAVAAMLHDAKLYSVPAFQEAIRLVQKPDIARESLRAVDKSSAIAQKS